MFIMDLSDYNYTAGYDPVSQDAPIQIMSQSVTDDVPGINNTKFHITLNREDMPGFKSYPSNKVEQSESLTLTKTMNKVKLGQRVLVYPEPGVDPIEAVISAIDPLTNIILEVTFKDENKKDKVLKVKNKIVTVLPMLYSFFKMIKSWFK